MEDFEEYADIFGEAYALFAARNEKLEEEMHGAKLDEKTLQNPKKAAQASRRRAQDMKMQKGARDATLRKAGFIS